MQVELVSGPAGSWLKRQSSHCNPKMQGAVLWRSWLFMPISRWRWKSSHVQSFEDLVEEEKAAMSRALRTQLHETHLRWGIESLFFHAEAAQLVCMHAVVYHAPELQNRTSSQRQSYIVLLNSFICLQLSTVLQNSRTRPALNDKVT